MSRTGYVELIESPERLAVTPMQIDTFNREKMNLTGSPFVSGPGIYVLFLLYCIQAFVISFALFLC